MSQTEMMSHTLTFTWRTRRAAPQPVSCRLCDEIQQADVPVPAEALIWAFQTERRQFNLLYQWKSSVCSNTPLPVTKWSLIFSFEERLLTDPPLPVEAKHRTFLKLIEMLFFHFSSCILWAWISIWFLSLLKEAAERYDKDICERKSSIHSLFFWTRFLLTSTL